MIKIFSKTLEFLNFIVFLVFIIFTFFMYKKVSNQEKLEQAMVENTTKQVLAAMDLRNNEFYGGTKKEIFTAQTAELDKPDNVKAGIVQGKLNKHLADICFMDQMFVKDDKVSVAKKMEQVGKENSVKLGLLTVMNFQLGA